MKTMRGRSTRRLLPLLAVPLAGFAGLGATQAPSGAQRVAVVCGQTLSSNTTVANDLTNCADGIKIGAAGITVNLNGHTIDGAGLVNSVGIRNTGFADVTIQNGTVTGFGEGIRLEQPTTDNRLQNLRVSGAAETNGSGVSAHGQGLTIVNSSVFDNAGAGMIVTGDRSRITNNVASNNGSDGIRVFGTGTIVSGNRAISNGQDGIAVPVGENTQLTGNVANGNGERGFDLADRTATLTKNTASFNAQLGFITTSGGITDGGGNRADDNGNARQCENVVCAPS